LRLFPTARAPVLMGAATPSSRPRRRKLRDGIRAARPSAGGLRGQPKSRIDARAAVHGPRAITLPLASASPGMTVEATYAAQQKNRTCRVTKKNGRNPCGARGCRSQDRPRGTPRLCPAVEEPGAHHQPPDVARSHPPPPPQGRGAHRNKVSGGALPGAIFRPYDQEGQLLIGNRSPGLISCPTAEMFEPSFSPTFPPARRALRKPPQAEQIPASAPRAGPRAASFRRRRHLAPTPVCRSAAARPPGSAPAAPLFFSPCPPPQVWS